jgi:phosphoenolpyruvate carboxylase
MNNSALRTKVRYPGTLLEAVIREQAGEHIFDLEEKIRKTSRELTTSPNNSRQT